jgi:hypothetical protein
VPACDDNFKPPKCSVLYVVAAVVVCVRLCVGVRRQPLSLHTA